MTSAGLIDLPLTTTRYRIWKELCRLTDGGRKVYRGSLSREAALLGLSSHTTHEAVKTWMARGLVSAGNVRLGKNLVREIKFLIPPRRVNAHVDLALERYSTKRADAQRSWTRAHDALHVDWRDADERWCRAVTGKNVVFEDAPMRRRWQPRPVLAAVERVTYGGGGRY
jgi:hypothetical protein